MSIDSPPATSNPAIITIIETTPTEPFTRDDRVKIDADPEDALRALVSPRKPSKKK